MRKIYLNLLKKSLLSEMRSKKIFLNIIKDLKRDFNFHNKNTELLAIWTVLFMIITGLFVLTLTSNILVMLVLFALSVTIALGITFLAIRYLHAIKYHKKKQLLPKVHNFLNKSFKLRTLLKFIKTPSSKNFIKLNFKFTS